MEIECEVTRDGKDLRQLMHGDAGSIFALGHVPDVVHLVFDAPIASNALGKGFLLNVNYFELTFNISEGFQDLDSLRLCLKARLRGNSRGLRREMHKL
jgi:hypothetical protein